MAGPAPALSPLARAGEATATVALCVLVAAAGLLFLPGATDVFMLPKWVAAWVCVGVALAALCVATAAAARPWPFARAGVALAAVALAGLFAAGVSDSRSVALFGLHERYGGALSWVLWLGLFLAVVGLGAASPCRLVSVLWTLHAGAAAAALYGLAQTHGIDRYRFMEQSGAPTRFAGASLGNSNFLGGFLAIALAVGLALGLGALARGRRGSAATAFAMVVVQVWALWEAQSRGGMLAALAGAGVVLIVAGRSRPAGRWGRVTGAALAATALLGIVAATVVIAVPSVRGLPGPLGRAEVGRSESTEVRGYEWEAAWRAVAQRPLLGSGPDTFVYEYPRHRSRAAGEATGLVLSDEPHNLLLEHAVDAGLVGLAAFVAFVTLGCAPSLRRTGYDDPPTAAIRAGALGGAVAFLAQAWFSIEVVPLVTAGVLVFGVLAALDDPWIVRGRARSGRLGPTGVRIAGAAALATTLVLVLVSVAGGRALRASGQANLAAARADAGDAEGADATFAAAARTWPYDTAVLRAAGAAAEDAAAAARTPGALAAGLRRAEGHYEAGLRRQPRSSALAVDLARVATYRARLLSPSAYADADRAWARAVAADPNGWPVRFSWANTLNDWADVRRGDDALRRRALAQWEQTVRINPGYTAAWINLIRVYGALGDAEAQRDAIRRSTAALGVNPGAFGPAPPARNP